MAAIEQYIARIPDKELQEQIRLEVECMKNICQTMW